MHDPIRGVGEGAAADLFRLREAGKHRMHLGRLPGGRGLVPEKFDAVGAVVFLEGCPGHLEIKRGAIAKFEEGDGAIFDVEDPARSDLRFSPASIADPLRAEVSADAAGYRHHREIVHEMQGEIEEMHAEVVTDAAAGKFFLGEPRPDAGNPAAAIPPGAPVIDLSEASRRDDPAEALGIRGEAHVLADHEHAPGAFRGGDDFCRVARGGRHRFFEQHVLAGGEGGACDFGVEIIGQGDADDLNVFPPQEGAPIPVAIGHAIAAAGVLPARVAGFRDRQDLGVGTRLETFDVSASDAAAAADDSDAVKRFHAPRG